MRKPGITDLARGITAVSVALALVIATEATGANRARKSGSKASQRSKAKPSATPLSRPTPRPSESEKTPAMDAAPTPTPAATPRPKPKYGPNVSLDPEDLVEFAGSPSAVQSLIREALALTKQNLTYTYGSAEPQNGGMDCSGTIYFLLRSAGFSDVPRDSAGQYVWTRREGCFEAVISRSEKSFEFEHLRPGDLLFWRGTYAVEREFPITHVMLYLGTERKTKRRVMFGASDGRTYAGIPRWGVSVFDFRMPRTDPSNPEKSRVMFVGYGAIPRLREAPAKQLAAADKDPASKESDAEASRPSRQKTKSSGARAKSKTRQPHDESEKESN